MIRTSFLKLVRHVALELDKKRTNPAMSVLKTNCYQNWRTTREQQAVRNCRFCKKLSPPLWSIAALDRWPTQRNTRGLRRVFQAVEQQAFLREIALVTKRSRSWTKTCASSFKCISPLALTTTVGCLDLRNVSSSSELIFMLSMCTDAPESTTNSRSSGDFKVGAGIALT